MIRRAKAAGLYLLQACGLILFLAAFCSPVLIIGAAMQEPRSIYITAD